MRGKIKLTLMALVMMACSKEGPTSDGNPDYGYFEEQSQEMIVLGERLENPYKTENMTKALQALYPTKSPSAYLNTTDLYVRFLPANQEEYDQLAALNLKLFDYPLDYDVEVEGDWYHDPEIPLGNITWQYTVVPVDFDFPDIRYEIIDECYLADDEDTKSGIDWSLVERCAYEMTGNGNMLLPQSRAADTRPKGRITIVDKHYNNGKAIGVSGVNISCNSFVKCDDTYTDANGYYEMSKKFNAELKYRMIFENKKNFSIGFNLVLVPASVSALGKAPAAGLTMTVTKDSPEKLYKRCAVNNAIYDYIQRCSRSDLNIDAPPAGLRVWLFHNSKSSSAVMLRQGAVVDNTIFKTFLGEYSGLIKMFLPDITLGVKDADDYRQIYDLTVHELAHASHFSRVGVNYWDKYIQYMCKSFFKSGGKNYGDGKTAGAGYCEVAEMWAYYMQSLMYKGRYGGDFPTAGNSYWFKPDILRYLHKNGLSCSDMFLAMDASVDSRSDLEKALLAKFPSKKSKITQAFDKY